MTAPVVPRTQVVVTDIEMPFISMVVFILKWTIAAIPAMFILLFLAGLGAAVLGWAVHSIFGGPWPGWPRA